MTVFSLKGGSSSVKFTFIFKIIIVIMILINSYSYYNIRDATDKS